MSGAMFFLSLIGYAFLAMLAFPRLKAGPALLSGLCAMLFLSYTFVILLQWMVPTAYLLLIAGWMFLAAGIATALMGKRNLRSRLHSVGLWYFVLLSVALMLVTRNTLIADHDSLSYWARAVRELYVFDRFYIHGDATMFHMDYIPLLASLQYCVMRVFGWKDAYLLYVTFACIAASAAAMVDVSSRRPPVRIVTAVVLACAFLALGQSVLTTRADVPMLAVFSGGICCLFLRMDDSADSVLPCATAAAVLTGFKIYSGLLFSLILSAALLVEWRTAVRRNGPAHALRNAFWTAIGLAVMVQLSWSGLFAYSLELASYESAAADAAYLGETFSAATPVFSLSYLFSGNPRTGQLVASLTPENFSRIGQLALQTLGIYANSHLLWIWLFLLPPVGLSIRAAREHRSRCLRLIIFLAISGLIYALGLLGSYFVQAETSGDATRYLTTAMGPILLGSICLTVWLSDDFAPLYPWCGLSLMTAGLCLLLSPGVWLASWIETCSQTYASAPALAHDFYVYELEGQLSSEDAGKRALLLDASWGATEISSSSYKTHAYAYFALPVRVTTVEWVYGDYTQLDALSEESLRDMILANRCDLLILRLEDELYWDAVRSMLSLDDDAYPIAVYDVAYEDGNLSLSCRVS